MNKRSLEIERQSWPLLNEFRISRGTKTQADVLQVTIGEGTLTGHAEAVPYSRYDETIESVINQIESVRKQIENGMNSDFLNLSLPAGAARNALDCALWELEAKKLNQSVAEHSLMKPSKGCTTAQTLSIDTPKNMAQSAAELASYPLIKIKLDDQLVIERMTAVYKSAPKSRFIIDANEAWNISQLNKFIPSLEKLNVALIEQPLASDCDEDLTHYHGRIPLCADESIHTSKDLDRVARLYQYINIKLDKTGGLTEAIKLLRRAQAQQIGIMIGCMVGTSLAMAPATLLTAYADFVDLDGPALLAKDRAHGFKYQHGKMTALNPKLWGGVQTSNFSDRQFRFFHKP